MQIMKCSIYRFINALMCWGCYQPAGISLKYLRKLLALVIGHLADKLLSFRCFLAES